MIGAVVLEWFFQASKPRNERHAKAKLQELCHVNARDEFEQKLAVVREQIFIEDAKEGDDYDSGKIYDLIAEERLLIDQRNAEQFGALVAGADRVLAAR